MSPHKDTASSVLDEPQLRLHRVDTSDYRAFLPGGTEVRVSGRYVDPRESTEQVRPGWNWEAQINGEVIASSLEKKRDGVEVIRKTLADNPMIGRRVRVSSTLVVGKIVGVDSTRYKIELSGGETIWVDKGRVQSL